MTRRIPRASLDAWLRDVERLLDGREQSKRPEEDTTPAAQRDDAA